MILRLELVDRPAVRRARRRAYHRRVVDGAQAFIGRTAELDRLSAALARVHAGESRMVVVAGEAGIGKTRLVEAFAARGAVAGTRVMSGGCLSLGTGGLPYAPFVEAFRALLRDVDPGALPALLGPNRGELARLLPEIRGRSDRVDADAMAGSPGLDAATDDRFAQVRLFELVLGVFERLAQMATVILVIEDIQWADPSTLDLLTFLLRNLRDERVLLIATMRTDEFDPGHALRTYLAELERVDRVDRIDVPRFGRDDLAQLLDDGLGRPPDADLVDRTWHRTGGNPFYAEQVLAASHEATDGELPARLKDVVLARVAAVSDEGRDVLRVASAAGARIDDDLLVAVSELPASTVRQALREVVERRILVRAGGANDPHLVFQHALLQEVILGDLFPGERARRHAGYAVALQARAEERAAGRPASGPTPSAAELAYHWDGAGDPGRALWATLDAAQAAERGYAFVDAHRRYLHGLELWDQVSASAAGEDGGTAWDRIEILGKAAETAMLAGAYPVAVEFGRQAIASVDATADPGRAAALHERQRWYLWEAGDRAAATAAVVEAEHLVPADPPSATRARILAHHAGILMLSGRFAESIPIAEEAISVARSVGSAPDEALALGALGCDLAMVGQIEEGIELVRAGLAIADGLGGAEGIALGATNLAVLLDRVGRTSDALETATVGFERARALGVERTYGGLLLAIAAKAAIALGRWDEAERFLRTGLAREPVGTPGIRLRIQRGRLDTFRGDIAAATTALADARAADEASGGTEDRASLLAALADVAALAGRLTEARVAVDEGLAMAAAGLPDPALASLAAIGLRVEADAADRARARRDDAALDEARRRSATLAVAVEGTAAMLGFVDDVQDGVAASRGHALLVLCRAEALRVDDRDDTAVWLAVGDAFHALGRPFQAAYARFRAGARILRERGPRDVATTVLATARATAAALGARPLLIEIDQLARQARLDLEPAVLDVQTVGDDDTTGTLDLTPREVEVLRMIATGWSNQQIADALFITRKTASVHASHIFDKLGAANRVEAAAIAHRLGIDHGAAPPPGIAGRDAIGR